MSLSQTEKERLKSILKNVYGWSSPTAQWYRVPESWCRDRETTSSNVDVVRENGKKTLLLYDKRNASMRFVIYIICLFFVPDHRPYIGDGATDLREILHDGT